MSYPNLIPATAELMYWQNIQKR